MRVVARRETAMSEFLSGFCWHSSIGIDETVADHKKFVTRLPNSRKARANFVMAGENLLVHKATQALWKISDDQKSIEPVFATDVLTDEDLDE
jgi:hypothetical protein